MSIFRVGFITLVAMAVLSSRPAVACSCIGANPTFQAYANASAVFIGFASHIEDTGVYDRPDGRLGPSRRIVTLDVEEAFRGLEASMNTVLLDQSPGDGCAYPFSEGRRYLVYATRDTDGALVVQKCQKTRPLELATEDLRYIRGLTREGPKGIVYGLVQNRGFGAAGVPALLMPPQPVRVIAESAIGEFETISDSSGQFELNGLPPGTYRLTVLGGFELELYGAPGTHGGRLASVDVTDNAPAQVLIIVKLDAALEPHN